MDRRYSTPTAGKRARLRRLGVGGRSCRVRSFGRPNTTSSRGYEVIPNGFAATWIAARTNRFPGHDVNVCRSGILCASPKIRHAAQPVGRTRHPVSAVARCARSSPQDKVCIGSHDNPTTCDDERTAGLRESMEIVAGRSARRRSRSISSTSRSRYRAPRPRLHDADLHSCRGPGSVRDLAGVHQPAPLDYVPWWSRGVFWTTLPFIKRLGPYGERTTAHGETSRGVRHVVIAVASGPYEQAVPRHGGTLVLEFLGPYVWSRGTGRRTAAGQPGLIPSSPVTGEQALLLGTPPTWPRASSSPRPTRSAHTRSSRTARDPQEGRRAEARSGKVAPRVVSAMDFPGVDLCAVRLTWTTATDPPAAGRWSRGSDLERALHGALTDRRCGRVPLLRPSRRRPHRYEAAYRH